MMKKRIVFTFLAVLLLSLSLSACNGDDAAPAVSPPEEEEAPPSPPEVELSGSIPEGGRLYDKWWNEAGVDEPTGDQPLWASQSSNTRDGSTTWRCKECHGWDYMGADGAYGSGSHFTGFPGVFDAQSMSDGELLAWLDGSTNADHDFSAMGDEAFGSLVTFLQEGLVDQREFVDYEAKAPIGGDAAHGQELFDGLCFACHGTDGRQINFGDDEEPEYLGTVASGNPWEFIHKVLYGQPASDPTMPSGIDGGWSMQDVVDVLAYVRTMPTELASAEISVTRGGRLYDKWWKVADVDEPTEDNPVWARQSTNTRSGGDTWRCKECHAWDYMGALGPYASGSHFTGFPGVFFAQDKSLEDIVAQISGVTDPEHDFSAMGESAITDLATFIKDGQVDMRDYVDYDTKTPVGGDAAAGEELYMSTCTLCHGEDGQMINFHDADDPEYVGTIAVDNPWEFIHKVRNGQPGTLMPAVFDAGWSVQDMLDLLSFAQTLATE
jgi:thiosulfate dehydrogenase